MAFIILPLFGSSQSVSQIPSSLYDISLVSIDGSEIDLNTFKGKKFYL